MPKATEWNCQHLDAKRPPQTIAQGTYSEASGFTDAASHHDAPLLVLIPADRCNTLTVALPELSGRKLTQALRWAAEDQIAGPIEEQHVAPIQRDERGHLRCIVTAQRSMDRWLDALPQRPRKLLPDAACLPWQANQINLMPVEDQWLLRWGETDFDRVDLDLLELMLPELIGEGESPPSLQCFWSGDANALPSALQPFKPSVITMQSPALAYLVPTAYTSPINLMHGEYSALEPGSQARRWRSAAALAAGLVGLIMGHGVIEHQLLERQAEQLDQTIHAQFTRLFPEITRPSRHRVEAERAMAALAGSGSDPFLGLTSRVSALTSSASGLQVEALNFADRRLRVTLNMPSTADLEALQQQLRASSMAVEVEQLQIFPEGPQATLRIEQATP
ncbi:MAG: type II secretion system protein GspL [Pseudomonadota bacterium]